jgi:hypothetical protein
LYWNKNELRDSFCPTFIRFSVPSMARGVIRKMGNEETKEGRMKNRKVDNVIPLFFSGLLEASPPAQYTLAFIPTLLYINAMRLRRSNNYKEVLMKNLFKFLGIIALVVMIGFTMASCATNSNNTNGGQIASTKDSKKPMTEQETKEWLDDAQRKSGSKLGGAGIATQVMKTPGLTAAAPNPNPSPYNIPIGSKALIKNATNRKEVIVTITDHISHNPPIIIDVSPETAQALDLVSGDQVIVVFLLP